MFFFFYLDDGDDEGTDRRSACVVPQALLQRPVERAVVHLGTTVE